VNYIPPYGPTFQDWQRQVAGTLNPILGKLDSFEYAATYGMGAGGDDTASLTAFINHAIDNPGARHVLEAKTYLISEPLPSIDVSSVWLEGSPGDVHSTGSIFSGTVIKYVGSATSDPMLDIAPSGSQFLTGIRIKGIGLDCNSLAGSGLRAKSVRQCEFDLSGANAASRLFDFGVVTATLGENESLQGCQIRLRGRQVESSAPCLYLDGDDAANVSMNDIWCDFLHEDEPAIVCANSDNNRWQFVRTFCSGTATEGIHLLGGATDAERSRDELFIHLTSNLPMKLFGTADYTFASTGHRIVSSDWDNGTPAPILGTGAWIDCELAQSFTPTVTGTAGAGLATSSVSGSYVRQFGFVDLSIAFTKTAGTGYSAIAATLPFANAGPIGSVSVAKDNVTTGKLFSAYIDNASSSISIQSADGATAVPDGTYKITARYRVR
jgi:hypothetical protein